MNALAVLLFACVFALGGMLNAAEESGQQGSVAVQNANMLRGNKSDIDVTEATLRIGDIFIGIYQGDLRRGPIESQGEENKEQNSRKLPVTGNTDFFHDPIWVYYKRKNWHLTPEIPPIIHRAVVTSDGTIVVETKWLLSSEEIRKRCAAAVAEQNPLRLQEMGITPEEVVVSCRPVRHIIMRCIADPSGELLAWGVSSPRQRDDKHFKEIRLNFTQETFKRFVELAWDKASEGTNERGIRFEVAYMFEGLEAKPEACHFVGRIEAKRAIERTFGTKQLYEGARIYHDEAVKFGQELLISVRRDMYSTDPKHYPSLMNSLDIASLFLSMETISAEELRNNRDGEAVLMEHIKSDLEQLSQEHGIAISSSFGSEDELYNATKDAIIETVGDSSHGGITMGVIYKAISLGFELGSAHSRQKSTIHQQERTNRALQSFMASHGVDLVKVKNKNLYRPKSIKVYRWLNVKSTIEIRDVTKSVIIGDLTHGYFRDSDIELRSIPAGILMRLLRDDG